MNAETNQTQQQKVLKIPQKKFLELYSTDYSSYIEQINAGSRVLSYISWAHCLKLMKENFESLFVAYELNNDGSVAHQFKYEDKTYCEVRPYLTDGEARTPCIHFPVMNPRQRHAAALNPDSRQISDACLRGAVKCIAVYTGIGLSLYAGEDLPDSGLSVISEDTTSTESVTPIKESSESQRVVSVGDMLILNCSFKEKEEVKALGARWSKELKKWYINKNEKNIQMFDKWLDSEQVLDEPTEPVEAPKEIEEDEDVPF